MRTVIYARKSTESEDRQVQSLEDQLTVLRALASREGLSVAEEIVESRSAREPGTRPEFERLISKIREGKVKVILTWHINRLCRNMVDGGVLSHLLYAGDLDQIRTPERTYRREDSVLLLAIENGMATAFVHDLSRAVKRGMRGRAERGWLPGRAPIGYLNDSNFREIHPDPVRFELLRKGWEMLLTGDFTVAEIHRQLVKLGLTQNSRKGDQRPLSPSALYNVFVNPFYKGVFHYDGEPIQGKHRAMVSEMEFEVAGRILVQDKSRRYRKHFHAYGGMLFCKNCGCRIVGETKLKYSLGIKNTHTYHYYHCSGARGCRKTSVTEQSLTDSFWEVFQTIVLPVEITENLMKMLQKSVDRDSVTADKGQSALMAQATKTKTRLDTLLRLFLDGEILPEEYRVNKVSLETELLAFEQAIKRLQLNNQVFLHTTRLKLDLMGQASQFMVADVSLRRAMVNALGDHHCLDNDKLVIEVDPVIQEILKFEPLKNSSERALTGAFVGSNSPWQGLVERIRTLTDAHTDPL